MVMVKPLCVRFDFLKALVKVRHNPGQPGVFWGYPVLRKIEVGKPDFT
jgi:hypothetical protein